MSIKPSIVWFQQDLRIEDQPALSLAIQKGGPVIPLYIWSPEEEDEWALGGASRWWLHHSLASLQRELKSIGLDLILKHSSSWKAIKEIVLKTGADAVFWNRRYEPYAIKRNAWIKSELTQLSIKAEIANDAVIFEPWTIMNGTNKPYQIFTHFWKKCCSLGEPPQPALKPKTLKPYQAAAELSSLSLDQLPLLPHIHWDQGLAEYWKPGSLGAKETLKRALEKRLTLYSTARDYPAEKGTTELSPHLHFGEISVRSIWHSVRHAFGFDAIAQNYLRQLGWRDFAYYLLYHFPATPAQPLHSRFRAFPWDSNLERLRAWQKGQTGFPIIDAGMRQLWHIGWMHNRVRMIVGSFLVKDLLLPWQEGAKWFWDTLVDADLANNTLGWQWVGGCGADAAPYFRIFNPITQGEKFDANGDYVRRWIPELARLPKKWIHKPWEAPADVLKEAGVALGVDYPQPLVDHAKARIKALEAFSTIRQGEDE